MKLAALAATGALLASLLVATPAQVATVKINAKCDKANSIASVSGKPVKCTKSGSKLVWKQYTPKATSKDQVPLGAFIRMGDWSIRLVKVNRDASKFVCSENMFNEGCVLNDDWDGVPDPESKKRWVEFVLEMKNRSKEDLTPDLADVGVLSKGKVVWQGFFQPTIDDDPDRITLTPGAKSKVSYFVYLDKKVKPTVLAVKNEYFSKKAYYFKGTK